VILVVDDDDDTRALCGEAFDYAGGLPKLRLQSGIPPCRSTG
jgi:hypothetical protein